MIKKILLGLVVILLLQIDNDLKPEIADMLEQAMPAESSEAYLYLLGIVAAESEDPSVVGRQLFTDMQRAEEHYTFGDQSFEYEAYPEDKMLPLPQGELFCDSSEEGCWQAIFNKKQEREQVLQANTTLLERYNAFISLPDYHSLAKPTEQEVFPPFSYLIKANRLVILNAINTHQTAEYGRTINVLTDHVSTLRNQLMRADNLVAKMVYSAMISDNLDALSLIIHASNGVLNDEIASLSLAERDLALAMSREFAMGYGLYTNLDRNSEFFGYAEDGWKGYMPGWLVRVFFKPNMTANDAFIFYSDTVQRSQLAQTEFAKSDLERSEEPYFKLSSIRNSVGNILNSIARPNFDQYIARLFDLNTKISIFNQIADKAVLPIDIDYIQNPNYGTGDTAYYSEEGKSICLTGPLEDERSLRCLRVKL